MADIVIINPRFDISFWGMENCIGLLGKRANLPVACLALLAALVPDQHNVTLIDENVEEIDFARLGLADIVCLTGMSIQGRRMREILEEVRSRGVMTVVGGPMATVEEEALEGLADVVFVGEADHTWPEFLRDWERGCHKNRYVQQEKTDMARLPLPRVDLLKANHYMFGSMQISRGCPFTCEFCDIIVTFGRRPRLKTSEQVLAELESFRRIGLKIIFVVDDNLIGNKKAIKPILRDIIKWQQERAYPLTLFTEASLDLAEDEELMELMGLANFQSVFIGIETPNEDSLRETKKFQNVRPNAGTLVERVHRVQQHGIDVWCGMIVGFDHDDPSIFDVMPKSSAMRFLGIGDSCDLGALYLRLAEEGHEVKVFIAHPLCQGTLAGLIEHVPDWRTELPWVLAAGENGFILFENVGAGRGEVQDALRRDGHNVIGSSTYGARLENDRGFAQRVLAETGLSTAPFWEFSEREEAIRFLEGRPARYVLKFNGPDAATYVGRLQGGDDVKALLTTGDTTVLSSFILMEFVDGVEMGVGAYFNGAEFLQPVCLDWEHKRFFPGDLGELTGEMGTVVTYSRSKRFFDLTLGRMEAILGKEGYCGYVNLNTIVNEQGIWPLEFTCRFGYPGFAILDPLQKTSWADLFHAMITRSTCTFVARPGFAVGIGVTTPPFPYSRSDIPEPIGLPVLFEGDLTPGERRHVHYGEVGLHGGALVTSGMYGWTMVVTGVGASVASAQTSANLLADRVLVPNARYRRDIGRRLIEGDLARVEALGLLDPLV